jgi:hypothetical protein
MIQIARGRSGPMSQRGPPHALIAAEDGDDYDVLLLKCRQLMLLREVRLRAAHAPLLASRSLLPVRAPLPLTPPPTSPGAGI